MKPSIFTSLKLNSKMSIQSNRHVLNDSVLTLQLYRWRKEIEEELSTLRAALDKVEERIATMYTKPELRSHEYRLHAVMVHEGDVNQVSLFYHLETTA